MMRQANEPSVEEILDSIKKVIARDSRADAPVESPAQDARASADRGDDSYAIDDVLELAAIAELNDEEPEPESGESPLVAEDAAISMRDSFAALAMLAEPGVQPQIVRSGETSLEALTRDLLRPALAQWLDVNLPPLVERMVAQEISRIVGKKR